MTHDCKERIEDILQNRVGENQTAIFFSLSVSFLIFFVSVTIVSFHTQERTFNRITMLPYYFIIGLTMSLTIYIVLAHIISNGEHLFNVEESL